MKTLMILLLCHTATAVTHSLMDFVTGSSGLQNVSEFFGVLAVDGVSIIYCDSSNKIIEPRQDWMKLLFENSTEQEYTNLCFVDQPVTFRNLIQEFMQYLNHSGAHFLQRNSGCQWDENTGEVTGTAEFGYDGEGFLAFDIKTLTYFALKPEAIILQHQWNSEIPLIKKTEEILKRLCPDQLKLFLSYGKSSLQRKVLPSVSLLQKTPSSPVSCHATGFYPDRAAIFWRKDGEEIHEGVDPGDILPNNDDTFQMSVDLNILSVTPEDWRRYDCVFQLSGVSEDIITKLNKTIIKTNWVNNKTHIDAELPIIIAAFVLVFILIVAIGIVAYKKKKESHPAPCKYNVIFL
ncbi:unnamed protein product [Oreochromis niloticus]|nr:unnamed protein product [Mustela putorius furo]